MTRGSTLIRSKSALLQQEYAILSAFCNGNCPAQLTTGYDAIRLQQRSYKGVYPSTLA